MNLIVWFEIPVNNIERAISFYELLLGKKLYKDKYEDTEYAVFPHNENEVAGCLILNKKFKPSADVVLIYLNMQNKIDEAISIAKDSGCIIVEEKREINPWGYRAIIIDTEGNKIALHST